MESPHLFNLLYALIILMKRKVNRRRGKGILDVLKKAHRYVKSNKLISRGLAGIDHEYARKGSTIASALGYGRKRRVKRKRGRGIMDVLRKAHKFVKENKLISRGLSGISHPYAQTGSKIASTLGYGKRHARGGARMRYDPLNVSGSLSSGRIRF